MVTMDFDQPRPRTDPVVEWMLDVRDYYQGGPIVPSGDHTYDPEAVDSYIKDILDEMLADRVGVIGGRPSRYGPEAPTLAAAPPVWEGPPGTEPEDFIGDLPVLPPGSPGPSPG